MLSTSSSTTGTVHESPATTGAHSSAADSTESVATTWNRARPNVGPVVGGTLGGFALLVVLTVIFVRWRRDIMNRRKPRDADWDVEGTTVASHVFGPSSASRRRWSGTPTNTSTGLISITTGGTGQTDPSSYNNEGQVLRGAVRVGGGKNETLTHTPSGAVLLSWNGNPASPEPTQSSQDHDSEAVEVPVAAPAEGNQHAEYPPQYAVALPPLYSLPVHVLLALEPKR